MKRRGFLAAMLGAAAAPAIVKAENLMRIVVPKQEIVFPDYMAVYKEAFELTTERLDIRIQMLDLDIADTYPDTLKFGLMRDAEKAKRARERFFEHPPGLISLPTHEVQKIHAEWLKAKLMRSA